MCEPCYRAALSRRGNCQGCGAERRLVSPPGPGARRCAGCAGVAPLATCRSCGAEERPYLDGCCVRCALATRARPSSLGGPEGRSGRFTRRSSPPPSPTAPTTGCAARWRPSCCGEVAAGQLALTHRGPRRPPGPARGRLPPPPARRQRRPGPARDDALVRLEAWVAERLASVEDKAQRRLLRSYATWRVLRRARQRAEAAGAPRTATRHAKVNLNSAIAFLGFLAAHQVDLARASQADLDDWLAEGPPSAPEVRDFLGWAADRRLSRRFDLPGQARQEGPVADDDERWATARLLLHDEGIELGDRVAGLLVLLYGQQLSRIAALTRDQVELSQAGRGCTWGPPPSISPRLWTNFWPGSSTSRRPYAGVGSPAATRWLFSGLDPGLPLTASQLGQRLRRLGVRPAASRRCRPRPLGGSLARSRAGPSSRPVPGHCCALGRPSWCRLGRICRQFRPLCRHRRLRPPRGRLPPLPPAPQGAVGASKDAGPGCRVAKTKLCGVLTRSIATMEARVRTEEGWAHCTRRALHGPTRAHPTGDRGPCQIAQPEGRRSMAIRHISNIAGYQFPVRGGHRGGGSAADPSVLDDDQPDLRAPRSR